MNDVTSLRRSYNKWGASSFASFPWPSSSSRAFFLFPDHLTRWSNVRNKKRGAASAPLNKSHAIFRCCVPGDADGLFSGSDEVAMETVEMRDGENETK